ncbi:MAG: aminopeptidase P family protein [Bdellovibrionales bacterium]|nr:aminopeptidase P family protein [Bdellovibrionales bacterium]
MKRLSKLDKKYEIYKKRRSRLIKTLPSDSAFILPSWPLTSYPGNIEGAYQPCSHLIYFTGWTEPHSCLVILSGPPSKCLLFVQKKDPEKELWTGPVYGPKKAKDLFQMDMCYPYKDFSQVAPSILKKTHSLYYTFGINPYWDFQIKNLIQNLNKKKNKSLSLQDPLPFIASLRMKKSKEEIQMIKKAVNISGGAHRAVMKYARPGLNERALYGKFLFEIRKRGAQKEAYPGIFASGPNACILHYTNNNRIIKEGEMVLVDAGAEYKHYASDITRTWPVNGCFSKIQKKLYTKLLKIQKDMIQMLKPGLSFNDIQKKLVELLSLFMKEEALLSSPLKEIINKKEYKKYFPHSFGHLLGLDVHDLTFSEKNRPNRQGLLHLEEGFVLTMEPGLYLPERDRTLNPELRGLGFRIEDDILITKTGAEVLSHGAPKEVEELEDLINSRKN